MPCVAEGAGRRATPKRPLAPCTTHATTSVQQLPPTASCVNRVSCDRSYGVKESIGDESAFVTAKKPAAGAAKMCHMDENDSAKPTAGARVDGRRGFHASCDECRMPMDKDRSLGSEDI